MSKKILYICPSSGLGGAETFLKTTFLRHNQQSFSPVYLLFQKGPLAEWLEQNGAIVELLQSRPRLSRPWTIFKTHQFIKKIIDQHSIDLVHSTMAYGALFSSLASWQKKKPHLWFQHGPASGWMDQLAALLPHDCVVVNSDYTLHTQRQLEKPISWLIKSRSVQKITLGIESPVFSQNDKNQFKAELVKKYKLNDNTVLFAMACRLQKWKGVHLVVEAASQLKNKNFFVFIWGDVFDSNDYVQEIKKKAKGLPVAFEGPISNVPLAFATCDVVMNASLQPEPFGLTLIEGLSVGKALLAPNEGGPKEIIEEKKTGLFFAPRSTMDLSKQMNWFIENSTQLKTFKENSLAVFQKKYTSHGMINQLEETYKKLML
ncbi:glycosyltransferase family 4 protein [bacterium]|nr:glycosyltransferase family 4 protein [bacterium]